MYARNIRKYFFFPYIISAIARTIFNTLVSLLFYRLSNTRVIFADNRIYFNILSAFRARIFARTTEEKQRFFFFLLTVVREKKFTEINCSNFFDGDSI